MQVRVKRTLQGIGLLLFALVFAGHASAGSITGSTSVNANAVIYAAGTQGSVASGTGGTVPGGIALTSGGYFTFANVMGSLTDGCGSSAGCITLNGGSNLNDPDGGLAAVSSSSETGAGSISGMTGPGAGYLVGVFIAAGGPSGSAPAALNFLTSGTSFTSLSPLLDQVFFIGDGLTGDGSGSVQKFHIPTGAGELYLGISDACGYNGGPSCYGDNFGTYSLDYTITSNVSATPEPSSLLLFGTSLLGLVPLRRKLFRR
jgi:hypothetical protein